MFAAVLVLAAAQGTLEFRSGPDSFSPSLQEYIGVDLRAANTPVRQALANIGRQVPNVRFDVAREVQGNVNTWFINLPYDKALDRLASQVGAQLTTYQETKPDPKRPNLNLAVVRKVAPLPTYSQPITIDFQDVDIRDALRHIFRQADISYTVDVNLRGRTTAKSEKEPLYTALAKAMAPLRGAFNLEGGIFITKSTVNPVTEAALERRPISFAAEKERRQTVLARFARQAGITLELEGNVNVGERVTFKSEGQSVGEVLRAILGNKHTFNLRDGMLVVTPGQPG